jgi:tetratricopeptide (TPR) repeat protein
MKLHQHVAAVCLVLGLSSGAHAGLYYSGEPIAELPSQWRGFLLDQRTLRTLAVKPTPGTPAGPARARYEEAWAKLEKAARERKLTADELGDLGAILVRLGETGKAVELLRTAQREHPHHFVITANLGTAWQLQGDLEQAAACLKEAVRLAPGKYQKAEEYQLKLVRLRQREGRDGQGLDDLFGVRYVGENGKYEAGKIAEQQRKKLPADAVTVVQQLALWLPSDARLLWQLAELANAYGDVRIAAAILEGCATEFGLRMPELREHRQVVRAAADALAQSATDIKAAHEGHVAGVKPRSSRPLLHRLDLGSLPPIDPKGVNPLPWAVLGETTLDRRVFKPLFVKYLQELNGKEVVLTGFMQPFGDDLELSTFMLIEYPVGCWYCEMPEIVSIVLVELPADKTLTYRRGLVKVQGKLVLNSTDPENFLYTIDQAKVSEPD